MAANSVPHCFTLTMYYCCLQKRRRQARRASFLSHAAQKRPLTRESDISLNSHRIDMIQATNLFYSSVRMYWYNNRRKRTSSTQNVCNPPANSQNYDCSSASLRIVSRLYKGSFYSASEHMDIRLVQNTQVLYDNPSPPVSEQTRRALSH